MKTSKLKYFSLIFICLNIFLFSCKKKDEKLSISGTTFNSQLNQPVGNVNVVLYAKTVTSGTWNTQYSTIGSTTSGSDGSFSFQYDNIRVSGYKISFSKTGYFTDDYKIDPGLVQKGENYNQTYYVHQEAWLKLLIKNFYPYTTDDVMSFKLRKGAANCEQGCSDTLKLFYGSTVDTLNICKIWGSQWAVLEWNVASGATHLQYIDTLWISPSDTTIRNLYY